LNLGYQILGKLEWNIDIYIEKNVIYPYWNALYVYIKLLYKALIVKIQT